MTFPPIESSPLSFPAVRKAPNRDELKIWLSHQNIYAARIVGLSGVAHVEDWTSFATTWTAASVNPAIGNGTITGKYRRTGNSVTYHVSITMGSTTTTGTGEWYLDLPYAAADEVSIGSALAWESGIGKDEGTCWLNSVTGLQAISDINASDWGDAVPFTWADGDIYRVSITYETDFA